MRTLLQALNVLLPVGYVLAAVLHGMAFGGVRGPAVSGLRRWTLRTTLVLHAALFLARTKVLGHFPVCDLASTLSAVAFSTAFIYAWLARYLRHPGSGGIVLGFVVLLQVLASAFADLDLVPRPHGMGPFPILHVTTSVLAASALVLSGIHGVLYIVLFREMRERRFGALFDHLPSLDLLARMTRRAAFAGFVCLTIGLNVGIWLAHKDAAPGFAYRDPEVLIPLVLWVHFGVVAFSEHIKGFGARRASIAAAVGFAALVIAPLLLVFPGLRFHSGL